MPAFKRYRSSLLTGLAIACSTEPEPGCDVCTSSAIVYGTITSPTGAPVAGAGVRVEAFRDACVAAGGAPETTHGSTTPADGSYRGHLLATIAPFRACLRVTVTPHPLSGLAPRTMEGVEVSFLADYGANDRDSVRVDVALSP